MPLAITFGAGKRSSKGTTVELGDALPPGIALAKALEAQASSVEAWWSPHLWSGSHRGKERWIASAGVGIDLDWHDEKGEHVTAPAEVAAAFEAAARAGSIPGTVAHLTPRGARVVYVFSRLVENADAFARAARGAGSEVAAALARAALPVAAPGRAGYELDEGALLDLARLLYSPRARVEGVQRNATLVVMREDGVDPSAIGAPEAKPARVFELVNPATTSIAEAVDRYNRENARALPRNGGDCPICGHKGCFGSVPGSHRWSCFSANHSAGGKKSGTCWAGDFLDLDAWADRCDPIELLKRRGYLERPQVERAAAEAASVTPIAAASSHRTIRSNSYASIVFILREPSLRAKVLGVGALEYNEMTLQITLNRRPLEEADVLRVRELCETALGQGDAGYKFSREAVQDALLQVAKERRYHPVRDYLRSLVWDHEPRIVSLAEDVLNVARSELVSAMLRKFMIAAVARAMQPGCKADNVVVLVGPGGLQKSAFFKTLAGAEWFADTAMAIGSRDAFLQLHSAWIYEWAELETMQRAWSQASVKGFLSSSVDTFRAPYARELGKHPRSCLIVGTTNERDFLTDPTGNRRYWIIDAPHPVALDVLAELRDQLWAEAVAAYDAGEQWWLSPAQELELAKVHEAYMARDPWEDRIRGYLAAHKGPIAVSGILATVIEKRMSDWTKSDEMRVGRILQTLGYERRRVMIDGEREYRYVNKRELPF